MMDKDTYTEIAGKIADGTASEREIALYNTYYNAYQRKYSFWDELTELQKKEMIDETEEGIHKQLSHAIDKKPVKLWPRIAVAAAVAVMTLGVWLYYASSINGRHPDAGQDPARTQYANDIAPGKNGATITLGNGKVIALSDAKSGVVVGNGKIFYSSLRASEAAKQPHDEIASIPRNDGVGENSMILTASTAKGQTYQFTLPDGTKVWLNADSKISFPSQFSGKQRKILLNGEGYFEVAKDKAHPFIVQTDKQEVEVLGTHFNINAYHNEKSVRTTLLEGSVRVALITSSLRGTKQSSNEIASEAAQPRNDGIKANAIVLKPNQQSILADGGVIRIEQVDVENITAWQKGYFMFNNETLENIMKRVARWYDVEVIYENDQTKRVTYYGTVSRFENISKVLSKLQATSNVKFKIESKKIYISE